MYHEAVPKGLHTGARAVSRLFAALLPLLSSGSLAGCADRVAHAVSWPSQQPEAPAQPRARHPAAGVELELEAMSWGPETVAVELRVHNQGSSALTLERRAILLAWDGLEYPQVEAGEPGRVELAAGEARTLKLVYRLGRPLTDTGAALVLRGLEREGAAIVELPRLSLPAMPVS